MPKLSGIPRGIWLVHEIWWRISRRPEDQRRSGRQAIANHYVNRHLRQAVQAAGIPEAQQPDAWQRLVRALDQTLTMPRRSP